ncbi:MAG: EAL domain-containing protein [Woeseiaceae bacterium]|nr:EAL domain-containing protein [Woeseiaceae bacterium]
MNAQSAHYRACLVDDDDERAGRLAEVFGKNGFEMVRIGGAQVAEHDAEDYDLFIVCGARVPDLCRQIRRRPGRKVVYVLALPDSADDETIDATFDSGATDVQALPLSWPAIDRRASAIQRSIHNDRVQAEVRSRNQAFLKAIPDTIVLIDRDCSRLQQLTNRSSQPFRLEDYRPRLVETWKRDIHHVIETGDVRTREFGEGEGENRHYFEMRMVRYTRDCALMIIRDTTQQKRANAKVLRLAFYDTLTGLPNRQSFMTRVSESIRDAETTNGRFCILYLDLDNFKRVNDSLGHTIGDELLKAISRRIEECVRSDDVIARSTGATSGTASHMARLGGDEFTVLLRSVDSPRDADVVADRIAKAVSRPIVFEGREFVFTSSVGIVSYPEDGTDIDTLLANADMAMYRAKDAGKNTVRSFSDTMSIRSLEHMELENELRQTISDGGLALHYQPKLCLKTGAITGFEALCRWEHPERGFISPEKFIHIAVETGMILELSDWVLNEACSQLAAWQGGGLDGLPVAINLSGQQFSHSDVHQLITTALHRHGIPPRLLELELTESELMADANRTIATLNRLKDSGLSIAVDDFGTGYSSLAYLNKFPIDSLKIDRSFAMQPNDSGDNVSICSAIVALAHSLRLKVIAEGVETFEHQQQLVRIGCDEMQGFLFATPQCAREVETFVRSYEVDSGRQAIATQDGSRGG